MDAGEFAALIAAALRWDLSDEERAARERLAGMDRTVLVGLVSRAMAVPETRMNALFYARHFLPDPRLAPSVAEAIRSSSGSDLLWSLKLANAFPYPALLPALIEHAMESDWGRLEREVGPGEGHVRVFYVSVFQMTAELLYAITGAEVGLGDDRESVYADPVRKAALREAWRTWWETVGRAKYRFGEAGSASKE